MTVDGVVMAMGSKGVAWLCLSLSCCGSEPGVLPSTIQNQVMTHITVCTLGMTLDWCCFYCTCWSFITHYKSPQDAGTFANFIQKLNSVACLEIEKMITLNDIMCSRRSWATLCLSVALPCTQGSKWCKAQPKRRKS